MADAGPFGAPSVADGYRTHLEPVVFAPWAERLLDFAGLATGDRVVDVASGTGVVARAAARRVGREGSVIATDVSADMLDHVRRDGDDGQVIDARVCSAFDLAVPSGSADAVLCQQGLQFFGDPGAALGEMQRVLRPGGSVATAVWLAEKQLDPFSTYGEVCSDFAVPAPFPGFYDNTKFTMSADHVEGLLEQHGFTGIEVVAAELTPQWRDAAAAAQGIRGTPLGPALAALEDETQRALFDALCAAFQDDDGPDRTMYAVLARGTAGA